MLLAKKSKWMEADFVWLRDRLKEINEHGDFNCLFSDGEYLFSYYDKRCYNTLKFLHRRAPFERIHLVDEDAEFDLAKEKRLGQEGFIIATTSLTNEHWTPIKPGELIVLKDGCIVYSSHARRKKQLSVEFSSEEIGVLKTLVRSPHRLSE